MVSDPGIAHFLDCTECCAAEVRTMFEQEGSYASYLDAFFRDRPNGAISWIHDLGHGRYGSTGHTLLKDADIATNLEGKHVC
jgi:nuclear pore complex protein Nup133